MKYFLFILTVVLIVVGVFTNNSQAATCTPTGFVRDSINLTAALINPKGKVTGDVDATGCNIGIYYDSKTNGNIDGANIHGANYFGVVNNGGNVSIQNSSISDIGEKPLNGSQHGVGIYFAYGSASKGNIQNNLVWNYQKGGIVVNGTGGHVNISQNTVIGQGPVSYIAQNGIQIGYGADADASQNVVFGNSYTGPNQAASGGIIVVGGDGYGGPLTVGAKIEHNILTLNDVGVWFSNLDLSFSPPTTSTKNVANGNTIRNNTVNNTTGNGPTQGYQAGISDQGNNDQIQNNYICGSGYTGTSTTAALYTIDDTYTNNVKENHNTTCTNDLSVLSFSLAVPTAGKPVLPSVIQ